MSCALATLGDTVAGQQHAAPPVTNLHAQRGFPVAKTEAVSDAKGSMVELTPFTLLFIKSVLPDDRQFRDGW